MERYQSDGYREWLSLLHPHQMGSVEHFLGGHAKDMSPPTEAQGVLDILLKVEDNPPGTLTGMQQ